MIYHSTMNAAKAQHEGSGLHLTGKVAVVTGSSRGGGRGIAVSLGEQGATVYVTGRSVRDEPTTLARPGTIEDTAEEVSARGGVGIPVRCDHFDDSQVEALFDRIAAEQGRLDLLVNNAWSGYELPVYDDVPFWELDLRHWELMFGSLRAVVIASRCASPLLLDRKAGLIVNITWIVGERYHGNLFYDVVKTAVTRVSFGMAEELRPHGVAVVALSPGWMACERMNLSPERAERAESTEFVGRAVGALAADPAVMARSGRLLTVIEAAAAYWFSDVGGRQLSPFWQEWLDEHPEVPLGPVPTNAGP
jgi:NAD(P)-dependent dehydrogenase (short-subunit alcohol dehydrogenase family)